MNKQNKEKFYKRSFRWMTWGMMFFSVCTMDGIVMAEDVQKEREVFTLEGITVEAKRPDWESKLSPGTVTVIRTEDYKGEQKSLPELLKNVPGVHVREVNGKGQYTTVTVRGSTAAQVGVFIDGVMTNLGGDAAVDISTIPVKNVERIEIYRGYIPSRFGGTFIGGVINVVTKKPKKTNISAEIGKISYGGATGALEVTAPFKGGSLMVGLNYETHQGDFFYKNYAAKRAKNDVLRELENRKDELANIDKKIAGFHKRNIKQLTIATSEVDPEIIELTPEEKEKYENNEKEWINFVKKGELEKAIDNHSHARAEKIVANGCVSIFSKQMQELGYWAGFKKAIAENRGKKENEITLLQYEKALEAEWKNGNQSGGYLTEAMKTEVMNKYANDEAVKNKKTWLNEADPEKSETLKGWRKSKSEKEGELADTKDKYKGVKDIRRHRRYNDRESMDGIVKWQNNNWMIKGTWTHMSRHLPDSLWGDSFGDAARNLMVDVKDIYYASSRKQTLDNKELLIQNRYQKGDLEWGWFIDYLHQDKKYKTENKLEWPDNFRWQNIPLREWSRYQSNKYNIQLDGTYKLNDRQMIDFQANCSKERLTIDGSQMNKVLEGTIGAVLQQIRNKYEQEIYNIQIQDSITLDEERTWVLTPSFRYNQSKITGYSNKVRFGNETRFKWIHEKDSQVNGKGTWQLALKKKINEDLTVRATGGTYYRLLNMYEIAGDGAGILPMTTDGKTAIFPVPEYGKQFDIGLVWTGKALGADQHTTLTYFWRNSERMLQLYRVGLDFWCYFNDNKGRGDGFELQSNWSWDKFSIDAECTHTDMHMERKNTSVNYGYSDIWATYQPEWEGNLRCTWMPNNRWALFNEIHYTGSYFTYYGKSSEGSKASELMGRRTPKLITVNMGLKWKPQKHVQIILGCNDVFDQGPKLKIWSEIDYVKSGYINPDFIMQGRTYYGTLRYEF